MDNLIDKIMDEAPAYDKKQSKIRNAASVMLRSREVVAGTFLNAVSFTPTQCVGFVHAINRRESKDDPRHVLHQPLDVRAGSREETEPPWLWYQAQIHCHILIQSL